VADLRREFEEWSEGNLASLSQHSRTLMESEWYQSMILLYRPCLAIRRRKPTELFELWNSALGFTKIYRRLVESNEIFYIQIASEKAFTTGLALLYSYWQLHRRQYLDLALLNQMMEICDRDDEREHDQDQNFRRKHQDQGEEKKPRSLDLWNAIGDINFILRALSDRWEEGKLLTQRFERISASALEIMATRPKARQSGNDPGSGTNGAGDDKLNQEESDKYDDEDETEGMPPEIVRFWQHSSLTSILTAQVKEKRLGVPDADDGGQEEYLKEHVLEVVRGRTT
jgi:hypothetical protein